jgi:hypothetical protein
VSPPALRFPLSEWHESVDYVRPEERGVILEGREEDIEINSVEIVGNGIGEKAVGVSPVRSLDE